MDTVSKQTPSHSTNLLASEAGQGTHRLHSEIFNCMHAYIFDVRWIHIIKHCNVLYGVFLCLFDEHLQRMSIHMDTGSK